ncbi:MAG TPA: TonB-dependent receptor [Parabacteroides johnsonii]|uniref:TonB-dependent receptor n=1 Tax=Parabacteroides johnsonii TaxID=387661 RepID=UPI001DD0CDDA|nr:TonB-dependent receptor [Parabacteroides johnsonii]HJG98486.1 TonB-dependent receptor [Parabacteroides johnsonii]
MENTTIQEVLATIEQKSGFYFTYNLEQVKVTRKVTVNFKDKTIPEVLNELFAKENIHYVINDKHIALYKGNERQVTLQTKKNIKGVVTDKNGEPIPGVNIIEKGNPTNGTITDVDGNFALSVSGNSVLVASYIGYNRIEIQVKDRSVVDITLSEDTQALEEVVVVGYSTQKKVNLTGSVSTVNFEEMSSRPVTDASQALSSASPGLQIMQSSGQPNAESFSYNIRGVGTLNSSSPLILVDGMEQSISMVNPSDIANVSILKDAASCAIYGNRGANGVILITTKNGTDGKISVTYDGTVSYNEPFKIVHTISDYVLYMKLMNESSNNLGNSDMFSQSSIDLWEAAKADPNGISASGYPNYVAYPNTDWWDEIYTKQWMHKHTISLNGKEKKTGYSMSFSYIDNPGIMKNTGYNRYMGRVNLYSDITDWLRVGTRTSGNVTDQEVSVTSYNGSSHINSMNTEKMVPCIYPYYDGKYGAPEGPEEDPQSHNGLWDNVLNGFDKYSQLYTEWYAQVKFLKYFTYNFDFYYQDLRRERKVSDASIGKFSFSKGAYSTGANDPSTLYTRMYYTRTNRTKLNHLLNYNQSFGIHDVSAMVGYEEETYDYRETNVSKLGLTDAAVNDLNAATTPYSTAGYGTEYAARSVFGRANYAYKSRYLLEFNLRYDGSSRFSPDYRWGAFPSFSAGWRMNEESWLKPVQWLTNLKLRASWGKLGNNAIGNYDWQSVYSAANYSTGQALTSGIAITSIANAALTWEETAVTNVGLDFGFFDNKLNGNMDVYNKLTTGILYTPDMYMVMGNATAPKANIAEVTNRGIELELGWRDNIGKDFSYSIKGQFSFNKNFVSKYKGKLEKGWNKEHTEYSTNIGDVSTGSTTRVIEGRQINEFYLPNVYNGSYFNADGTVNINGGPKDGMIRTENDMQWLQAMQAAGYTFQPYNNIAKNALWYGEYIYADANGDGVYGNSYDSEFQGTSTTPKYNFGIQASANWKDFDLSMTWGGSAGFSIYYYGKARNSSETTYGYAIPDAVANDHYFYDPENPSDPRTNLSSKQPRLVNVSGAQSSASSSLHLEKGNFIKLRNLTLGYTMPKSISKKFYVERLRVYASGENLFAITGFSGMDPEMRVSMGYSTMRQYAFGINLTF